MADFPETGVTPEALLKKLALHLRELRITEQGDHDFGAIHCPYCGKYHIRAAEAAFAFAYMHAELKNTDFLGPAASLAKWAIARQRPDGRWEEEGGEWPGVTVFLLMSLAAALPLIGEDLPGGERDLWKKSIRAAAEWVRENITERAANINYLAGAAAALALAAKALDEKKWNPPALNFAFHAARKINVDGLVDGEGVYSVTSGRKGIDIGYGLDMSLAAIALYLKLSPQPQIAAHVQRAIETHIHFFYPDGALDNSFGSRSFKWAVYGSKTAHGCQMALDLAPNPTPATAAASRLNMKLLSDFLDANHIGEPAAPALRAAHHRCIYPVFCRANNLAFALLHRPASLPPPGHLPSHTAPYHLHFKTANVHHIRTRGLMATISGYSNRALLARTPAYPTPCGGAITLLWHHRYGIVQAASQIEYSRVEPLHLPDLADAQSLTPRIEARTDGTLFTSAYDHAARIVAAPEGEGFIAGSRGRLRDRSRRPAPVKFDTAFHFDENSLRKVIKVDSDPGAPQAPPPIRIVEPVVVNDDTKILLTGNSLSLQAPGAALRIEWTSENFTLEELENEKLWASPFPLLQALPLIFTQPKPSSTGRLELIFTFD